MRGARRPAGGADRGDLALRIDKVGGADLIVVETPLNR